MYGSATPAGFQRWIERCRERHRPELIVIANRINELIDACEALARRDAQWLRVKRSAYFVLQLFAAIAGYTLPPLPAPPTPPSLPAPVGLD